MQFFATMNSPLGPLSLSAHEHAITGLTIGQRASSTAPHPVLTQAMSQLEEYFAGTRTQFDVPTDATGTPFQEAIWRTLSEIPFGQATRWTQGVSQALEDWNVPWQVTQLGTRAEYSFLPHAPHDGGEAAHADDFELQQYLHLHALNRGILMTPFPNMALMSPATSSQDVDAHTAHFREAVGSLYA